MSDSGKEEIEKTYGNGNGGWPNKLIKRKYSGVGFDIS
jgi:hypothetical protein